MTEKEKIGNKVKELREKIPSSDYSKEHISQQELADKSIGITKHLIGTIERGEANPTLNKIILLAKSLNQDTFTILGIEIDVHKFIKEWEKEQLSR